MCGIAGLALIATLGVKGYKLDQALSGEQGFMDGVRDNGVVAQSQGDMESGITVPSSVTDVQEKVEN